MSTLRKRFTATLQKSPSKGGWTFVVLPNSAEYFGTRGLVNEWDGRRSSVPQLVHGDGRRHAQAAGQSPGAKAISKQAGDTVTIRLEQRLND
jgi:hypothetical protein